MAGDDLLSYAMHADPGFRHHAFVHESQEEHVSTAAAFLKEGLERGEAAVCGDTREGLARMREALGADASSVTLIDVGSIYTRPARTLAAYHSVFREQLQKAPAVRAFATGEVLLGPPGSRLDEWTAYEALTNVSYSHLPVWVVCSYDANGLPDPTLEAVLRTHSDVLTHDWAPSPAFEDPRAAVREHVPEPKELAGLRSISFDGSLESFREQLAREAVAERVPSGKSLELLVAATEIATNAIRHGGGIEEVRVGSAEGRFVCEVIDRGIGFDDPLAGYLAPREGVGTGLWVARQLAWRIEFLRSALGFTARIWL